MGSVPVDKQYHGTAKAHSMALESADDLSLWVLVEVLSPRKSYVGVDASTNLLHTKGMREDLHFGCGSRTWHVHGDGGHRSVRGAYYYTRGMKDPICEFQCYVDTQNVVKV
jgi:hypothetical protein